MRTLCLAVGIATAATLATAMPAQAMPIGASGDVNGLRSHTSGALATHKYGKLSGPAVVADLVNIETTVDWSQVANGSQDANIRRWANALRGKNIMVSWSHEPMAKQNIHFGNAQSFIASFRHVVSVFNRAGSTSVKWVYNATSYSFKIPSSRSEYGGKWYPGDSYVDYIAGESYNWCGRRTTTFASNVQQMMAFASQHHKKVVVAEFASYSYSGRASWIRAATSFIRANASKFAGAFYFNQSHAKCSWHLGTTADYAAMRDMVNAL